MEGVLFHHQFAPGNTEKISGQQTRCSDVEVTKKPCPKQEKHICRVFTPPDNNIYIGLSPLPVTVTTRIITFLVGDPYKPSFATVTGRGDNPTYIDTQNDDLQNVTPLFRGTCLVSIRSIISRVFFHRSLSHEPTQNRNMFPSIF